VSNTVAVDDVLPRPLETSTEPEAVAAYVSVCWVTDVVLPATVLVPSGLAILDPNTELVYALFV
jgi:hypothetical protein